MKNKRLKIVKTFKIIFNKNQHEYDLIVSENSDLTKYEIFASHSEDWHEDIQGKSLMVVIDDGNGFILENSIGKNMDFSTADRLRMILNVDEALSRSEPCKRAVEKNKRITIHL